MMGRLRRLWSRLRPGPGEAQAPDAARTQVITEEVDREIAFHLRMRAAAYEEEGMGPEEARKKAEQRFGPVDEIRARGVEVRRSIRPTPKPPQRSTVLLSAIGAAFRDAWRTLSASPGFALLAMMTLALGVGANATVFGVVELTLLRPLPFEEPERLFYIPRVEPDTYRRYVESPAVEAVAGHSLSSATIIGPAGPSRVETLPVTDGFFEIFGIAFQHGRPLAGSDHVATAPPVAVITTDLAHRQFGDAEPLGKTLRTTDLVYTVVGVMPSSVSPTGYGVDLWIPLVHSDREEACCAVARSARGVSTEKARRALQEIAGSLDAEVLREQGRAPVPMVQTMRKHMIGTRDHQYLMVLYGLVGLVLLIACVNFANLVLARTQDRMREFAVRSAIGAGRGRLVTQVCAESLLLALGAAVLALLARGWATAGLTGILPFSIQRFGPPEASWWSLLLTLAVASICGTLFALPAVFQLPLHRLRTALPSGPAEDGGASMGVRRTLVVGQVAATVLVVAATALFLRSYLVLRPTDPGFTWEDKVAFRLEIPEDRYPDEESWSNFAERLQARLSSEPGIDAAHVATTLPLTGLGGGAFNPDGEEGQAYILHNAVTPGYFAAMEIPVRGRAFQQAGREALGVAIVNERMARRMWPEGDALGQTLRGSTFTRERVEYTVVGVAGDTRFTGSSLSTLPEVFVPFAHEPRREFEVLVQGPNPDELVKRVGEAVKEVDPELPIISPGRRGEGALTMHSLIDDSVRNQREMLSVVSVLSLLAVVLTVVGQYGVMAYMVSARQREIGVRMAVGARTSDVRRLILRDGMWTVVYGVALGLVLSFWGARTLEAFVRGVAPHDAPTYAGVTLFVLALGAAGAWIPARRASRVDPNDALRA